MERRAAIYCRISDDREGRGLGVQRQEADCRALAERLGWQVIEVFQENDTSAYSGKTRKHYQRMLAAVEAGRVDAVIAWHNDRLHRSPSELEHFISLLESRHVAVQTVTAGVIDLNTPSGRMIARQLGVAARYESEHKSERIRRKHRELAEGGKIGGGGTRPFGYNNDRMTVCEDEALLIKEAAERLLTGEGVRTILKDWTKRGVSTVTGKPWQVSIFRNMMMRGRIAGWREHKGELIAEAVWPGIISVDDLKRIRTLLRDPARVNGEEFKVRKYALTGGFSICGVCGAKLSARASTGRVPSMVCASGPPAYGCGKIRCQALPLEDYMLGLILGAVASGDLDRRLSAQLAEVEGSNLTEVQDGLRAARSKLEELAQAYARDAFTLAEWEAARKPIAARVKDLESQENALLGAGTFDMPKSVDAIQDAWETRGLEWRRALVRRFFKRIVINPAVRGRNTFDPNRIHEVWFDESD
jgi:site-specific DNA recombinase